MAKDMDMANYLDMANLFTNMRAFKIFTFFIFLVIKIYIVMEFALLCIVLDIKMLFSVVLKSGTAVVKIFI